MCKSYCYDENDYKNFDEWKEAYVEYLKGRYKEGKRENIYQDPDCKSNYRLDYYKALAEFLKQREGEFLKKGLIDEKFDYEADNYPGKGVLILVKSKDGEFF